MYVIGHLYYLKLNAKLPLHADARTRLFNQITIFLDLLKISVYKRDENIVCKENAWS